MNGTIVEHEHAAGGLEAEWRLFEAVDAGHATSGWILWGTTHPTVVVGRHTPIDRDVDAEACRGDGIPVLRRSSGGGAVVLGSGCLNYALALTFASDPLLEDVSASFGLILHRLVTSLRVPGLAIAGGTDLALANRKVSGNAQRRGRSALLQHGTLLYAFDAALATRYLREPTRQPTYRARRSHADFLGALPLRRDVLEARLVAALGEWLG